MADKRYVSFTFSRAIRLVARALLLRCPNCGRGTMFATWLRVRPACRECRLRLDRGEHDYFIGGYTINLVAAELVAVSLILGFIIFTWPGVPWTSVMWGTAVLMLAVPFVTYPYSKALWLAIDLAFRPPEVDDFQPASEP